MAGDDADSTGDGDGEALGSAAAIQLELRQSKQISAHKILLIGVTIASTEEELKQVCISAAPAALDRYLAALPAMSLIPFAPFYFFPSLLSNLRKRAVV